MSIDLLFDAIEAEVKSATNKFPSWPTDPLHAQSILDEEVGELKKAILQVIYEPQKCTIQEVEAEAIQVGAMIVRFLMSLEEYGYYESDQHTQEPI